MKLMRLKTRLRGFNGLYIPRGTVVEIEELEGVSTEHPDDISHIVRAFNCEAFILFKQVSRYLEPLDE